MTYKHLGTDLALSTTEALVVTALFTRFVHRVISWPAEALLASVGSASQVAGQAIFSIRAVRQ